MNLALDEDYHVRKIISDIVESQLATTLIFQQILQDFASSKMPEMLCLVDLLHNNLLNQVSTFLTAGQKNLKSPGKKTREIAFLAVLNFFLVQKLIFGHF